MSYYLERLKYIVSNQPSNYDIDFLIKLFPSQKFDQGIQDEAFTDLKTVVCRVATNKPSIC